MLALAHSRHSLHNSSMTKSNPEAVYWDLEQILPINEFDTAYAEIEKLLTGYIGWQKKLTPDMTTDTFNEYMQWQYAVSEKVARLYSRPSLLESTDSKSSEAARLKARATDLYVKAGEVARPISMWLKGKEVAGMKTLDDANAQRLFASVEGMEYPLSYARQMASHTLTQPEESIISHKDATGVSVLTDLREMIETDFTYQMKVGGKTEKYATSEELKAHIYSPDAERRAATYRALFAPYKRDEDKFFRIYQAVVKDWAYEAELRGYKSPIAMRNAANQVPDAAIEALMKVCEEEAGVFQGFFRWKADKLGLKKLTRFDLYAPLSEAKSTYSYSEAVDMVIETFTSFSSDFAAKARQILEQQHVDSHPAPTKRSGAFCSTIAPSIEPYVLLNFSGKSRDVSTLAHELGHGVHSMYADHLPISSQHPNLPLAETASTFGEMILFEALLEKTNDASEREALMAEKIADSYATILRQNYFVKFEIAAHEAIPKGAGVEEIRKLWLKGIHQQFGDAIEIDDIFGYEWAYIPHIVHTPFYCYAYNFGELLSLSLYARYKAEGKSFVPKIEAILAAGGSREPKQVLEEVGIDFESQDFWRGGFEIIKSWVDELKK